jgi:hypothetical protein
MGFVLILIAAGGLVMVLGALSTLIKYRQLAKLPAPEKPWRDRVREPRITR